AKCASDANGDVNMFSRRRYLAIPPSRCLGKALICLLATSGNSGISAVFLMLDVWILLKWTIFLFYWMAVIGYFAHSRSMWFLEMGNRASGTPTLRDDMCLPTVPVLCA